MIFARFAIKRVHSIGQSTQKSAFFVIFVSFCVYVDKTYACVYGRALKDIGLKITKYIMDNKAVSMDFSNYGRLNPPKELFEIVAKAIRMNALCLSHGDGFCSLGTF